MGGMGGGLESSDSSRVLRALAGELATGYVRDHLLAPLSRILDRPAEPESLRSALLYPDGCLRVILGHYLFSRRGRDRGELARIALEGLDIAFHEGDLVDESAPQRYWAAFEQASLRRQRKPQEQLNRAPLEGLVELYREVRLRRGAGSISGWIVREVHETGRLEPAFLRLLDVRGLGPKSASMFVRDLIYLYGIEDRLQNVDRLYVQPIDRWTRLLAPHVIEDLPEGENADWVVAGKVAKAARRAGVSGIRVNMGVYNLGVRLNQDPDSFDCFIRELIQDRRGENTLPAGH